MRILITGASGNVGSQLTRALAGEQHTIISISRDKTDETHGPSYAMDMSQPQALAEILQNEKPDAIIHLASILGKDCDADPQFAEKVNVEATRELARLAATQGVRRFIFVSTSAVYNQRTHSPTSEDQNVDPQSLYGQTKLRAEMAIDDIAKTSNNTTFVTLRPFNIYGPGFNRSLVYNLIHSTPDNPVSLFGFNNLYRDYIHVSDVIKAIKLALIHDFAEPHTIMNIGSGVALSNASLVKSLEEGGLHPSYTRSEQDSLSVTWADISRAKAIGFDPQTTIIIDQ
jgi:UDP-glucose 4-epimerase